MQNRIKYNYFSSVSGSFSMKFHPKKEPKKKTNILSESLIDCVALRVYRFVYNSSKFRTMESGKRNYLLLYPPKKDHLLLREICYTFHTHLATCHKFPSIASREGHAAHHQYVFVLILRFPCHEKPFSVPMQNTFFWRRIGKLFRWQSLFSKVCRR